jgi:hypothetical protein
MAIAFLNSEMRYLSEMSLIGDAVDAIHTARTSVVSAGILSIDAVWSALQATGVPFNTHSVALAIATSPSRASKSDARAAMERAHALVELAWCSPAVAREVVWPGGACGPVAAEWPGGACGPVAAEWQIGGACGHVAGCDLDALASIDAFRAVRSVFLNRWYDGVDASAGWAGRDDEPAGRLELAAEIVAGIKATSAFAKVVRFMAVPGAGFGSDCEPRLAAIMLVAIASSCGSHRRNSAEMAAKFLMQTVEIGQMSASSAAALFLASGVGNFSDGELFAELSSYLQRAFDREAGCRLRLPPVIV